MKKILATILAVGVTALMSVSAFAAEPAAFICPNGYADCTQNGTCLNNGTCVNHESCVANGVCQFPENCPNGGVPKSDGTGYQNGGHHGRGQGRGQHGGNNCR